MSDQSKQYCLKCKLLEKDENTLVKCDSCSRPIHRKCAGLTASESKVMDLKSTRILRFFCEECEKGFFLVPSLLKKIDVLQSEIEELKTDKQPPVHTSDVNEDIIREIFERQKRMNNIMIFNMPESDSATADCTNVKNLLNGITQNSVEVIKVVRLGNKNKNGARALKASLSSSQDVTIVMKNKNKIDKARRIYINPDLTPKQQEYLKKVKSELNVRRENGEQNLVLRYINGQPKIQSKN